MENENKPIDADRVRELLDYDPDTGVFTWRVTKGCRALAGAVAGWLEHYGYIHIQIDGRTYKAHRLAWLHTHGCWPTEEIDHVNCHGSDNRLANLREATRAQNVANARTRRDSASGLKGAFPMPSGRYQAKIRVEGRLHYLGTFDTPEAAHVAYWEAAQRQFSKFARAA